MSRDIWHELTETATKAGLHRHDPSVRQALQTIFGATPEENDAVVISAIMSLQLALATTLVAKGIDLERCAARIVAAQREANSTVSGDDLVEQHGRCPFCRYPLCEMDNSGYWACLVCAPYGFCPYHPNGEGAFELICDEYGCHRRCLGCGHEQD